ncbi:hypothetical protein V1477_014410 [Vespula maculifrons]|uniref:Uncharacterized protein n=1 Tax=Vespula maculifrons TaxID=7453 RepID=A0ABD2BL01_VESMC
MKHFYESPRYDDGTCQIVITEAILCDAKEKLFRRNSNSNSNEEEEEEEEEEDEENDDDDDNDDYYREPIPDRFLARSYDKDPEEEGGGGGGGGGGSLIRWRELSGGVVPWLPSGEGGPVPNLRSLSVEKRKETRKEEKRK